MGIADYTSFMPSDSSYATPYDAMNAAKADALKRAAYLSEMDQFYAQLDESKRQFDQTYGLQVRAADLAERAQAWNEKYQGWQLALESRSLDINEALGFSKLDLEKMGLKVNAVTSLAELLMKNKQMSQNYALSLEQLRRGSGGGGGSRSSGGGGGASASQFYDMMQLQKERLAAGAEESRNALDSASGMRGLPNMTPAVPSSSADYSLFRQFTSNRNEIYDPYGVHGTNDLSSFSG